MSSFPPPSALGGGAQASGGCLLLLPCGGGSLRSQARAGDQAAANPPGPEKWIRSGPALCQGPRGSFWSCCSAVASGAARSTGCSSCHRRISKEVQSRHGRWIATLSARGCSPVPSSDSRWRGTAFSLCPWGALWGERV